MQSVHCLSVCDVVVLWPNGWMDHDETWHGGRLSPGHIVLDRDPAPPSPKGHTLNPQFSAYVYCDQMGGWIKMPFGMQVGIGPGDASARQHC